MENSRNQSLTKKIKDFFKRKPKMTVHKRPETDWSYNARKAEESKEVDRILEKIKHSGYNSLSEEEKKKLFDASKK
jgi:trehalose/maltose hydrolase-like predicted phosphorylase